MNPTFTRGFRLHHNGQVLDGAEFPSGRAFVVDDPEYGLASAATSMEELLKGYHGGRVEWPGDQLVPTALFLDLVNIAARVVVLDRARAAGASARAVLRAAENPKRGGVAFPTDEAEAADA